MNQTARRTQSSYLYLLDAARFLHYDVLHLDLPHYQSTSQTVLTPCLMLMSTNAITGADGLDPLRPIIQTDVTFSPSGEFCEMELRRLKTHTNPARNEILLCKLKGECKGTHKLHCFHSRQNHSARNQDKRAFASCRSLARRVEVFPVPPVRRIAIWIDWWYILFENPVPISESSTNGK